MLWWCALLYLEECHEMSMKRLVSCNKIKYQKKKKNCKWGILTDYPFSFQSTNEYAEMESVVLWREKKHGFYVVHCLLL